MNPCWQYMPSHQIPNFKHQNPNPNFKPKNPNPQFPSPHPCSHLLLKSASPSHLRLCLKPRPQSRNHEGTPVTRHTREHEELQYEVFFVFHESMTSASSANHKRNPGPRIRSQNREDEYEGPKRFCHCGVPAPRWTSWTNWNPGRRFFGCLYYDQGSFSGVVHVVCNILKNLIQY